MSQEACFVIIKPDAIERNLVGRIISRIEDTYMKIMGVHELHKTCDWAALHYAHLVDAPYYQALAHFMTLRGVISFSVVGEDSVARMRKLAGATDSRVAEPGTIRGDWGSYPIMYNLLHVSDSMEAANRERGFFYDVTTTVVQPTQAPKEEG